MNQECPRCQSKNSIKPIAYGMPGPDFEFDKYIVGGCCVTVSDPKHGCVKCDWRGFILKSPFVGEEARPSDFNCPCCGERGSMRQVLQGLELGELRDVVWTFSKTYEDEPFGNVVCTECGWSCIARDISSWANY